MHGRIVDACLRISDIKDLSIQTGTDCTGPVVQGGDELILPDPGGLVGGHISGIVEVVCFGADQPFRCLVALTQLIGQLLGQGSDSFSLYRPLGHDLPEVEKQRPFVLPQSGGKISAAPRIGQCLFHQFPTQMCKVEHLSGVPLDVIHLAVIAVGIEIPKALPHSILQVDHQPVHLHIHLGFQGVQAGDPAAVCPGIQLCLETVLEGPIRQRTYLIHIGPQGLGPGLGFRSAQHFHCLGIGKSLLRGVASIELLNLTADLLCRPLVMAERLPDQGFPLFSGPLFQFLGPPNPVVLTRCHLHHRPAADRPQRSPRRTSAPRTPPSPGSFHLESAGVPPPHCPPTGDWPAGYTG